MLGPALAVLTLVASQASAQSTEPDLRDEEARALFQSARAAFEQGRYEIALDRFREAYELSERPELLYNIAQSADRLRRDEEAVEAFERFLSALPNAPERAQVEARLAVLRRQIDEARANRELRDEHDRMVRADESDPGAGPWILVAGGGAVAIGGGVLLALALVERADVEGLTRADDRSFDEIEGAFDRVPLFSTIGFVGLGVGVAALTAGIVWLAASGGDEAQASAPGTFRF